MKFTKMAVMLLGILSLSFGRTEPYSVLTSEDWVIEEENSEHAALHTVDYKKNSFLKWWCFPSKDIEQILCEGDELGPVETCDGECTDDHYITIAKVYLNGNIQRFEWSVPVFGKECLQRSSEWRALVGDSPSACFFAAPWPPADPQYWDVYGIKTAAGRLMAPRYDPDYDQEVGDDAAEFPDDATEINSPEQD